MRPFLLAFSVLQVLADYYPDSNQTYALLQGGSDPHIEQLAVQITHWSSKRNSSTTVDTVRRKRSHRVPHSGESKYMKYLMLAAACVIIYSVFQACYCFCEKKRRESAIIDLGKLDKTNKHDGPSDNNQNSVHNDPYANASPKWKAIMERQHSYVNFSFLWPICDCCGKLVKWDKYECVFCYQQVHWDCTDMLEVPCIPKMNNKEMIKHMLDERLIHYERDGWEKEDKRLKERRDLPIDKWRYLMIPHLTHTNAVPQIPQQLILCVRALDKDHLHRETLYTDEKETWEQGYTFLKDLVKERKVPVIINTQPPYRITSAIKVILAHMTEALIRFGDKYDDGGINYFSNQDPFLEALKESKEDQETAIKDAFDKLGTKCEKLTLAFMIIHWKRVLDNSDANKITVERLAQSIGHFVIRHVDCVEVTKMLLQAKTEMWEELLKFETTVEESMNLPKDISKV